MKHGGGKAAALMAKIPLFYIVLLGIDFLYRVCYYDKYVARASAPNQPVLVELHEQ
jgi:hypothetical protein